MSRKMKLYVFDHKGAPDMPREARVCTGAPFDPTDIIPIPCMSFLIDHPDKGLILYDTGWSKSERHHRPWSIPEDMNVISRLAQLGHKPEDIKTLIMSHLHHDHSGYVEHFNNAEITVSDREFTGVAKLYALGMLQPHGGLYIGSDVQSWYDAKLNWKLLGDDEETVSIADGVELLHFGPGHSFGILCLVAHLPEHGTVVIAGDVIYCRENIGPPAYPPMVVYDLDGYKLAVDRLLGYVNKHKATIWYGHDTEQFDTLIKSTEGCYE
ncbi:MAG: N-acyl homoserine lactonase family protein [Oscillospiraceae bacterium]|nr:N-acyl homoserine lactonase family protein [Oscillospiraceae bacterium]